MRDDSADNGDSDGEDNDEDENDGFEEVPRQRLCLMKVKLYPVKHGGI